MNNPINVDADVAKGFGREWSTFSQTESDLSPEQRHAIFESYFSIFPWDRLPLTATGVDVGCGSGRWAKVVSERVAHLICLDVSAEALEVARRNLADKSNVDFVEASVGEIPLPDCSQDFAYSLGVLHHVPDTKQALRSVASKLKPGAPFLVYLYYAFDNRPAWFRTVWRVSDLARRFIVGLPPTGKRLASETIAMLVYWPLARLSLLLERLGMMPSSMPLNWYRNKNFYVMRTDAYDRFCTSLEQRFTRREIEDMLIEAGFKDIRFSEIEPFWCAVATRR